MPRQTPTPRPCAAGIYKPLLTQRTTISPNDIDKDPDT
jgi:hypothetical protein